MEKRFKNNSIKYTPKIIVITGAESTGKSTLTEELARHFNMPFIPELARSYIENLGRKYTYSDIEKIAELQIEQLRKYRNSDYPFIFLDTWLIVTKIWFEVIFKKEPAWLLHEIRNTNINLFLVCNTDIPWIPDAVRENGGEMREVLNSMYIETISKLNYNYKIISGKDQERFIQALHWTKELQ